VTPVILTASELTSQMAATVALKAALPVSLKDAVVNPDNSSEYELDTAVRSEGDGFTEKNVVSAKLNKTTA